MAVVNVTRTFRICGRIKRKQDGHDFTPIRTVGIGVQKAHVECDMRPVVVGQDRTFGRCVKKVRVRQGTPMFGTLLPIEASVNISILRTPKTPVPCNDADNWLSNLL